MLPNLEESRNAPAASTTPIALPLNTSTIDETSITANISPEPTLQATNAHDKILSVEEVCENFGLNDVNLDYSDAEYQNLTTYNMFKKAYRSRIQSANPKVRL